MEILCGDIIQLVEVQKEFFTLLNVCNFCVYVCMCVVNAIAVQESVSLVEKDMQPSTLKVSTMHFIHCLIFVFTLANGRRNCQNIS